MLSGWRHAKVFFAREPVDMRRQIDGLALEVQEVLQLDPLSAHIFVFRNRTRDKVKALVWDDNGFLLLYKRIERGRFQWPDVHGASVQLSIREFSWLLEGQSFKQLASRSSVTVAAV